MNNAWQITIQRCSSNGQTLDPVTTTVILESHPCTVKRLLEKIYIKILKEPRESRFVTGTAQVWNMREKKYEEAIKREFQEVYRGQKYLLTYIKQHEEPTLLPGMFEIYRPYSYHVNAIFTVVFPHRHRVYKRKDFKVFDPTTVLELAKSAESLLQETGLSTFKVSVCETNPVPRELNREDQLMNGGSYEVVFVPSELNYAQQCLRNRAASSNP
uniref:Ubiquitinyl hydrolase 1 n=1 Tax=Steinernema glaseri TaxID=37863 RepID=A0A1I7ZGM4_9BILA